MGPTLQFSEIEYDSRKIVPNGVFAALVGSATDGHLFIDKAIENGAKLIIVSKIPQKIHKDVTFIKVDDVRQRLGKISSNFYGNPQEHIKIIGVTGTNGKTTSTYVLEKILGDCARIGTI